MGKPKRKNSHCKATKNTSAKQKSKQKEIINYAITIAGLLLTILSGFFDIADKPLINFKWIASLLLILSSVIGLVFSFRKYTKPKTVKKKIVQYGVYLFWGSLFTLGAFLLVTNAHPKMVNQENTPQQLENDEQQLLMQAELYYDGGKYESLVELYSSEALRENPVALNNLGYMYSKGIYFGQNFDVAIQYYENASKKGLNDALHNLVSLKLHNCTTFQEVVDVLRIGYDTNESGTLLFLGSILEGKDLSETKMTDQEQNIVRAKIESFFDADNETQTNILSTSLEPWQFKNVITDTTLRKGEHLYERYSSASTTTMYTRTGDYVHVFIYHKYVRTFLYDNLMQEYFVSVTDPEQLSFLNN